jgi:hypothetical protein
MLFNDFLSYTIFTNIYISGLSHLIIISFDYYRIVKIWN